MSMEESAVEILLVEDNSSDAKLTLLSLREHKLTDRIKVVNDGMQALDYIFGIGTFQGRDVSVQPKVVLLDLKLPKASGTEVLRRLKSDPQSSHIPIVILTSSSEQRDVSECYQLGANSYIVKPVDFDQFLETMLMVGSYWTKVNTSL